MIYHLSHIYRTQRESLSPFTRFERDNKLLSECLVYACAHMPVCALECAASAVQMWLETAVYLRGAAAGV